VQRLAPLLRTPSTRVVVVGDGPDRPAIERALPAAVFTGFRSGADLSRHVASLDVFVHTGIDETFCQSVQEALSSGVPVVAPAAGGPLDLVSHGVNGYLWPPDTPSALAGAVSELVHSPVRREQMGLAARASVEHRTWPTVMDELEGHYRAAMSGLGFAYTERIRS
jgi:phosphatidylinositol alpha 1,6-mannosyltransferase